VRGSIALEFLLVVLAIAVYIGFTVKSVEVVGLQSAEDLSKMVRTRAAMTKIYNAVQFLAAGADGSSTTLYVYVPTGVNLTLRDNVIEANVPTEANLAHLANCTASYCLFRLYAPMDFDTTYSLSSGIVNVVVLQRVNGKVVKTS